jgi:hypothetical protein
MPAARRKDNVVTSVRKWLLREYHKANLARIVMIVMIVDRGGDGRECFWRLNRGASRRRSSPSPSFKRRIVPGEFGTGSNPTRYSSAHRTREITDKRTPRHLRSRYAIDLRMAGIFDIQAYMRDESEDLVRRSHARVVNA